MGTETIIEKDSVKLYEEDLVKYLIIINRRRAFPEIIDGLKPVQRRIIFDMFKQGATSFAKRIKSQAIVGDVQKWLHPHGDSIYGAIEPMASWYKIKVPLIAPKGNWGTLMGDPTAAARYTEAGLSDFCYDCVIGELKESKSAVDWVENFSRTDYEPEYFPVKLPLLLVEGSFGIGVGMNTNIPTHNLIEVCEAARKLIKNPNADIVLYPDGCQPCDIIGSKEEFAKISHTGLGKYKVRGKINIVEDKKGNTILNIVSLPDGVTTINITEKLNDMLASKELMMIADVTDASTNSVDIRIKLKKGADPNYIMQVLFTKTQIQQTVSVNCEVVNGNNPTRINYKEYLLSFLQQRAMTKFRVYCNKRKIASTRQNQLIAYVKLMESGKIDEIIKMVKKQKTTSEEELMEYLIKNVGVNDLQAKYILHTDIMRFSKGYLEKCKAELNNLLSITKQYEDIITGDGSIILKEIDQELLDIEKKYGSPRLCNVITEAEENNIPQGTFKVVITRRNFIRKIPDVEKVGVVRGDDPKFILRVENTENLLLFDNKGKVFKLPVSKILVTDKNAVGTDVRILCKGLTADIISVFYEPTIKQIIEGTRKHYIAIVTKNNSIKKLDMEDFLNVSTSGLVYTKVKDTDEVTGVIIAPADLDIVIYSKQKALRTSMKNIPLFKRIAAGNKAMNTNEDIEGISVIYPKSEYIVVLTEKGRINKFPITSLSAHNRGGAGINVIKIKPGDSVKSIYGANDTDVIRIVTSSNVVEVPVASIEAKSTVSPGESIVGLKGLSIIRTDLIYKK